MTPLIEACARALYDRHRLAMKGDGLPSHEWETLSQSDRDLLIEDARAVIPIVLEKAAEEAKAVTEEWETPEGLIPAGELIAEHILALDPETQV